jgi:cytochrome c oxidase subunit 2
MTFFDFSTAGQIGFQNPATPIAEGIIDLHHNIFFFLLLILTQVLWIFYIIFLRGSHLWQYPTFNHLSDFRKNYLSLNNQIHGTFLEIVWTITPSIILMMIAIPSFALLYSIDEVIDPEITIKVIGHQWYWAYEYSNNLKFDSYMEPLSALTKGDLRLLEVDHPLVCPIGTHLRLIITAVDVLHSLAVPSLGIKVDAVPGRLNQVSLFIKRIGTYYGQCSELCGVNHGFMPIRLDAKNVEEYVHFLNSNNDIALEMYNKFRKFMFLPYPSKF